VLLLKARLPLAIYSATLRASVGRAIISKNPNRFLAVVFLDIAKLL